MKSFLKGTLLFLLALPAATAYAQPVRIAGSGANVGAISLMSAEFRKQFPLHNSRRLKLWVAPVQSRLCWPAPCTLHSPPAR